MVELIEAARDKLNEVPAGLCQPDAPCVTLEQENTQVFLQRLYTGADARQADAERIGSVTKVQVLGNGQSLKAEYANLEGSRAAMRGHSPPSKTVGASVAIFDDVAFHAVGRAT